MNLDQNALNEAAWTFYEEWNKLLDEHPTIKSCLGIFKGGWLFNNIKRLLTPTIIKYFESCKEVEK